YGKTQMDNPADDDIEWQESRTFTGLTPGMEYHFYTRVAATDYYEAGPKSAPIDISTKGGGQYSSLEETDANNLKYVFDLSEYDGSVSANAVIDGGGRNNPVDIANLNIPETIKYYDVDVKVTEIKAQAFFYNDNLINVVIPDSVEVIGEFAFANCTNIENIQFGNGLKYIDDSAFASCGKVEQIVLQEGLEGIGTHAFANDSSLKAVFLPSTLQTVSGNEQTRSIYYNVPDTLKVYCRVSGNAIPGPKSGWEEYWNRFSGGPGDVYDTFWYKEDPEKNEVTLYSPESKYLTEDGSTQLTVEVPFTSVYSEDYPDGSTEFNEGDNTGFCVFEAKATNYIGVINSVCLNWALDKYDKVIIPEGNVAMMDGDVLIPQDTELLVEGDFATEAFKFLYENDTVSYNSLYFAHYHDDANNVLTNNGTIRVTGNLYTANMAFNALVGENSQRTEDYMSTIVSQGKIELLDDSKFYIYSAEEGIQRQHANSVSSNACMYIDDITVSGNSAIYVNTYRYPGDEDFSMSKMKYSDSDGVNNLTGAFGNNGLFVLKCDPDKSTGSFAIDYGFVCGFYNFISGNTSQSIKVLDVLTFKQGNIENYIYAHSIP
ncbi:MAG: leucine-rich repeat domain-containing protein, partial [Lachnospiraceae bacterium]|nr:leucine-rich repeat domain-containing protein [Lachnospiraceae bacterium]